METRQKHRIVFLIDVSLAHCEKCKHSNEILTSVVRLLSLFSGLRCQNQIHSITNQNASTSRSRHGFSRSKSSSVLKEDTFRVSAERTDSDDRPNVQPRLAWGVKFFSTNSDLPRAKSDKCSIHNDVNNGVVENFEKRLDQMLDPSYAPAVKRRSISHPSGYLMNAFRDILNEFEWHHDQDSPDSATVTSKFGINSRNSLKMDVGSSPVKHVFIFAQVPSSKQCLRRFCNKVVLDSDVFVESVMTPTLFAEYTEKQKIQVSWVNLNSPDWCSGKSIQNTTYSHSIEILRGAMTQLGGALLHKDYFIHSSPTYVDLPTCDGQESDYRDFPSHLNLFSIETVLPALMFSVGQSSEVNYVSCPLTLAGACAVISMKLLPLERSNRRAYEAKDLQKCKGSSSVQDDISIMPESNCDIDFTHAEMEFVGFVLSSAISKLLKSVDVLASYMLNCDNDILKSLLDHMFSSHRFGILRTRFKRPGKERLRFALMSSQSMGFGFISVLTPNGNNKIEHCLLHLKSTKEEVKKKSGNYNLHQSRLQQQFEQDLGEGKSEAGKEIQTSPFQMLEFFDSQILSSWHKPGSRGCIDCIIGKLNNSLNDNTFANEKDILKDLKKCYLKERQPYQLFSLPQPSTSTPVTEMTLSKMDLTGSAESDRRSSVDSTAHRRSGSLSRGRMMVDRARSASLSFLDDSDGSVSSKQGNMSQKAGDSVGFAELDLKTEDCLKEHLSRQYQQILDAGVTMEVAIQALVTVTCHFMASKEMNNPQKESVSFIKEHLVVDSAKLKEKIDKTKSADKIGLDVTEYKLQVILLLELESFFTDRDRTHQDKIVSDLVSLLRPLSFASGVTELRTFLESLTTSYCGTLPQLLMEVHDELDQPYPSQLARFASPSAPSSAWGPALSVRSDDFDRLSGYGSSQPPSNQLSQQTKRSSRLKQHPSFADFGQKKQILVKLPDKKKITLSASKKTAKDKGKQKVKSHKTKQEVDYDKAKRNLFSDKGKVTTPKKRRDRQQLTPKRKREKSKTLVPGTPAHKQTSNRMLRRQQKLRDHFNIKPEVQVVAESPVKDDGQKGDNRPAQFIVRQSFYSSKSGQSRNVAKSLELSQDENSQRIRAENMFYGTRSHGSLASAVRGESPLLSPRSRMIKSFCASPSSGEKSDGTPRSRLRRSPRKSAKKLVFDKDFMNNPTRETTTNPRLIFDGENASDIELGSRGSRILTAREGFRTPEKTPRSARLDVNSVLSLPPFSTSLSDAPSDGCKSKELNFKNAFSSHQSPSSKSNAPNTSQNTRATPSKDVDKLPHFSSPDQAAQLRSSFLLSPKRKSPAKLNSFSASYNHQPIAGPSRAMLFRSPTKSRHLVSSSSPSPSKCRQHSHIGDDAFSTPKKAPREIHSTPSKVTFSEQCLMSPPRGTSHPSSAQKMTPKKSILKNSPAFKANLTSRIQEAALHLSPVKEAIGPHNNEENEKASSFFGKEKIPNVTNIGSSTRCHPAQRSSLSNAENIPSISGIKRRILSFDMTASSSSNEGSNHVPPNTGSTTVVTIHFPSPTKKCKTPDMNKWKRKKRHSGSRNCSSSSSSPSLFSSSPSSSESKSKEAGVKSIANPIDSNSRTSHDNIPSKDQYEHKLPVNEETAGITKRNLFAAGDCKMSFNRSLHKEEISETQAHSSNRDVKRKYETGNISNKSLLTTEKKTLPTNLSGGFHPKLESLPSIEDESSRTKKPRTRLSSFYHEDKEIVTMSGDNGIPSSPRLKSLSSFVIEGSQGFQTLPDSPISVACHDHDHVNSNKPSQVSSHSGVVPMGSLSPGVTHQQAAELSQLVVRKTPSKKQFSPALSSSGLLQLIKSPLLDASKRINDAQVRKETRGKGKSRKHLDLI